MLLGIPWAECKVAPTQATSLLGSAFRKFAHHLNLVNKALEFDQSFDHCKRAVPAHWDCPVQCTRRCTMNGHEYTVDCLGERDLSDLVFGLFNECSNKSRRKKGICYNEVKIMASTSQAHIHVIVSPKLICSSERSWLHCRSPLQM